MLRYLALTLAIAIGLATRCGPIWTARQYEWWELRPGRSRLLASSIEQALSQFDGSTFSGSITIARLGVCSGEPRVWIGIRGVSDAMSCAQNLADVAGASLGDNGRPPTERITHRWRRISLARPLYANNNRKRRRQPLTVTVEAIRRWAAQVDTHVSTGHAIVITATPNRDSRFVHVIAATTSKDLARSWLLRSQTIGIRPCLVPGIIVPVAVAIVTTLLMRPIEVGSYVIGGNAAGWPPWMALPIVLLSVAWAIVEIVRPRTTRMIRRLSCLPLGLLESKLGGKVWSTQLAGWARVRNGVQNLHEPD